MSPPAAQPALDLLDAHLEALWDGADLPLPADPAGPAEGREGELFRWTLGRLRSIPREPEDAYRREIGGLVEEFRSRRCPWNAAALRLLNDSYTFVGTGPRRHEDWAHDALAVLHRSVPDPRGWLRLDWNRTDTARHTDTAYPFTPPTASEFPARLHPLTADAAVAAVAIMTEEWQAEPAPLRSRPDRAAALADARTLLSRYGPAARYWTNATAAAADPSRDFITAGLRGTLSHSFVTSEYVNGLNLFDDLGLIAVSDAEVGVFWSFGAY
ncbi:hypothetical protein SAVIM338S_07010 [Streptomyces avidinii]